MFLGSNSDAFFARHCGNEAEKVAAIKFWDVTDVQKIKTKRSKIQLSEVRRVVKCIDDAASAAGVPPQKAMTHAEVLTCYHAGKSGLFSSQGN